MGSRANFVIVENGSAKAYYDHWAALGCLHGFAAGPDGAMQMLADSQSTNQLMNWALAEGGFLIDFDDRLAIVFGPWADESDYSFDESEDVAADEQIAEFDASQYLKDIAPRWIGWRLIYDDRGVDAFAEYLQTKHISSIETRPRSHPVDIEPKCELHA